MSGLFAPETFPALVLLFARVGGLVLIAPVFSTKAVPASVRAALVVLLSVLLLPAAHGAVPAVNAETLTAELLIGVGLGLGAALLVGAATVGGDLMGMQIGLSGAAIFDPITNSSENALGVFGNLFAITLLLAVDAHLVMIDAVARSLSMIPLGHGIHPAGLLTMVRSGGTLFALGLQFAAPVVAAVLVANTGLAILSRSAPQLNLLSVAFPLQIGVGLTALAASIPFIGAFYHGWAGVYNTTLDRLLSSFVRGTP